MSTGYSLLKITQLIAARLFNHKSVAQSFSTELDSSNLIQALRAILTLLHFAANTYTHTQHS